MPICERIDVPKREIIDESSSDQLLASSIAVKLLNFGRVLTLLQPSSVLSTVGVSLCQALGNESSRNERARVSINLCEKKLQERRETRGETLFDRHFLTPFLNPRSLKEGGGGQIDPHPLDFFGFKFLLLDQLSKALAQLFLVCEHIF